MSFDARALVEVWRRARAAGVAFFAPAALARLTAEAGLPAGLEGVSPLEAVRAIEMQSRELARSGGGARLVVTSPSTGTSQAGTRDTARTLIQSAQRELLVVGFEFSHAGLSEMLRDRGRAGVAVTVVTDRTRPGGARKFAGTWPPGAPPVTALEGIEPETNQWFMHGKTIVADRQRALVGSANFTEGGLLRNVELGVLVEGKVAEDICSFIGRLRSEGWLTEARP